ncbi:hypothetical protein [Parafrankia discariae]|uniref:hypothetical protein n=1 Tax=Parafrankia discariae TaxID=365528 RepID=UPI0004780ECB|nr:hypothetical protein [Parafrankia discariae]
MTDCSDGPPTILSGRTAPADDARRRTRQGGCDGTRRRPARRLPRGLSRLTALALTGLVTVAVAGPAAATGPGGGPGGGGDGKPAPSVDGVKVGWLPGGISFTGAVPSTRLSSKVIIGTFEGGDTHVQLTVQRDTPDVTLDDVADAYAQYYPGSQAGRIALRDTEAVALRTGNAGISEVTWVEGDPSVVLTVAGQVGGNGTTPPGRLPEADLLRIAESLTVGPAPTPTVWQKLAEPLIGFAFAVGLNSSEAPARVPLAAVENGQRLVSLLEEFRATYPGLTARVTMGQIYFWAQDHASVSFTIAYAYQGRSGSIGSTGQAVFTHGAWKVSEQTYRSALGLASMLGGAPA